MGAKQYETEDDKLFISRLEDKIKQRDFQSKITVTDFLNIHEKFLCMEYIRKNQIPNYIFSGRI